MKKIMLGMCTDIDSQYKEVCGFAKMIYNDRHQVELSKFPDIMSYALVEDKLVGCFGLVLGKPRTPLLLETYFDDEIWGVLSKNPPASRNTSAEMGSRAVDMELLQEMQLATKGQLISLGMTAYLILWAEKLGLSHLVFTGNRSARILAKMLGLPLVGIGEPDLGKKGEEFRQQWARFFHTKPECFGFAIQPSLAGSQHHINQLSDNGFVFQF